MLKAQHLCYVLAVVGGYSFSEPASAQSACAQRLIIYHAGSLTAAFSQVEKLFTQQTGICVSDVAAGSVDAARRITAGGEPCDIYASADYQVIEGFLKPAGYADYDILFAQGGMVLAYTTNSANAGSIATSTRPFSPPGSIPDAAADWYRKLTQSGVAIGGSHPFLDPSGYRADLIFQLAEDRYRVDNLYDALVSHYFILKPSDALGKTFDYQLIYEHSAFAAYQADATRTYRYVLLPDAINLSKFEESRRYREAVITLPGLHAPHGATTVPIPATRVVWGATVLKSAPNPGNAVRFLQLLFGSQGIALQTATGPAPISPPVVSREDYRRLPGSLAALVGVRWWDDDDTH
jgi:molybdate/tungstate transport system substrate-binding protein